MLLCTGVSKFVWVTTWNLSLACWQVQTSAAVSHNLSGKGKKGGMRGGGGGIRGGGADEEGFVDS